MNREPTLLVACILLLSASLWGITQEKSEDSVKLDFEKWEIGKIPDNWEITETNSKEKLAKWEICRLSDNVDDKVFALTESKNSGQTYNLAIAEKTEFKDAKIKVKVKVKALKGKEDQGGGPIWRAKDKNNYYIARWNPLEDNYRVYYVKDGKRKQIATSETKADPKKWHVIEIEMSGNKITALLDGKKMMEVKDSTFNNMGMAGLWTKADAETAFDDFVVKRID